MLTLTEETFAENVFSTHPSKLIIVMFSANWCDSCQQFQQGTFHLLKDLYPYDSVVFTRVDVDECPNLADKYHIDKLPTFLFFKNRKMVNVIIGNEVIGKFKRIINDILNEY